MLLPRFTLRTGLIVLTIAALLSVVLREAWLGTAWAVGVMIAVGSVVCLFGVFAVLFLVSIAASRNELPMPPQRGEP